MGLASLAKLLSATFLRDSTSRAPGRLALWVSLGLRWGCTALSFSTMTHSIASRSGNKVRVDSGTVE
jgi:hypothetical protein